eukprot:1185002-Prorocentrum_minimum.AAC.2
MVSFLSRLRATTRTFSFNSSMISAYGRRACARSLSTLQGALSQCRPLHCSCSWVTRARGCLSNRLARLSVPHLPDPIPITILRRSREASGQLALAAEGGGGASVELAMAGRDKSAQSHSSGNAPGYRLVEPSILIDYAIISFGSTTVLATRGTRN